MIEQLVSRMKNLVKEIDGHILEAGAPEETQDITQSSEWDSGTWEWNYENEEISKSYVITRKDELK